MTRIIVYLLKISLFIYAFSAIQLHAKPWKGAEIITQDSYKFGAFEARIRAPKGSGMIVPFFYGSMIQNYLALNGKSRILKYLATTATFRRS